MKQKFFLSLVLATLSFTAFAEGEYAFEDISFERNGILHEMFLTCVKTKAECTTMAHHQGYQVIKVVTDRARCTQAPKIKACIVKH